MIKMVAIRELVNSSILNKGKWVGFQGDSEFLDKEEGEYKLGYWSFLGVNVDIPTSLTLDSEIDKSVLRLDGVLFVVKNDNDVTCIVRFYYDGDEL